MQNNINISEVNLAKDYREYLQNIGELFMHSFDCRWQALPLHGLNVNAPTKKKHGVIPLHPSNNKKESINFLETFANAFVWYAPKSTPLMFAANSDKPNAFQITKILVEHGANVNLKDEDGKKASERSNNPEIKKYLEKLETKQ